MFDVVRHVGPQEELVPELLRRAGEQSWYEGALGGTQPNPQAIFDILDTQAAVLELTAAAAGTRIVATAVVTYTSTDFLNGFSGTFAYAVCHFFSSAR